MNVVFLLIPSTVKTSKLGESVMCLHSPLVPAGDLLTSPLPTVFGWGGGSGIEWYTAGSKEVD